MSISMDEIKRRLRLGGEDSSWEFKEVRFKGNKPVEPTRDDLVDEMVAFANGTGGYLVCGITDDRIVQNLSPEQASALVSMLTEACNDSIKPRLSPPPEITIEEASENKRVVVVHIQRGLEVYQGKNGCWQRRGASKRKMNIMEVNRLTHERGQRIYPGYDERIIPNTGINTLDKDLWEPLLSAEGLNDPQVALEKMNLLAYDEHDVLRATVAGVLLCCKNPQELLPGAYITATRYRGNDKASGQADSVDKIEGPISQQISGAMAFFRKHNRVPAIKSPGRQDMPQYSEKAVFEAVVNAVAHRDYSIRESRIHLSMFEDRLEITSPGSLLNGLTIEGMETRQATRNEVITSMLRRLTIGNTASTGRQYFMEKRGDGVPIIKRETQELSGHRPEFKLNNGSELCVIIPAAPAEIHEANVKVVVQCEEKPVSDIDLLLLFPNKTWRQAKTNEHGEALIGLYTTNLPMTVFAAAPGFAAYLQQNWVPGDKELHITIKRLTDGGSVIFEESTGHIPGLKGRLNPKLDASERTYMYASNIAIDEGRPQPATFAYNSPIKLTDAYGTSMNVSIIIIVGRSALVEYRPA